MRLLSSPVLALSLAFAGCGCISTLRAQEASVASKAEIDSCVKWMKATVPNVHSLDFVDFCSGVKKGSLSSWNSLVACGQATEQPAGTAARYCTSSGQITEHEAWGAGFSSTTNGRELLFGDAEASKDSQQIAATFYSWTAVRMEDLNLPAGMYRLRPSQSPGGWRLAVAKQNGESIAGKDWGQDMGTIELRSEARDVSGEKTLTIWTAGGSEQCPGPKMDFRVKELHFLYQSTDLFVCLRPEQVPLSLPENMSDQTDTPASF
jgi:hypothetical protein